MKKKIVFILGSLLLICFNVDAAFEQQSWSVRAAGMGDAFVAVADDGSAGLYNPAGIGFVERPELNGMYSLLMPGLDIQNLGLASGSITIPLKKNGTFGLALASFNAAGLYQENIIFLDYANRLSSFIKTKDILLKNMIVGVNLKCLGHGFLSEEWKNEAVFVNGRTKYAFTIDAGAITRFYLKDSTDYFTAGLALFNIIEPDVGLSHSDPVPLTVKFGISYPLKRYKIFQKYKIESPLPAVAVTYQDSVFDFHAGWENKFFSSLLSFRFGSSLEAFNTGVGFNFPAGKQMTLHLNYCFSFPYYITSSYGNHRVSFSMDF